MSIQNKELKDKIKALKQKNTERLNAMHFGSEEELLNFETGLLSIDVDQINDDNTLMKRVQELYEERRKKLVETITSPAPQHYDGKGKTTEEWKKWYENRNNASKQLSQFRSKFWIDFNDLLDHYYDDKNSNIDKQELSNWKSKMVELMLNYFQEYNRDRWMYHFFIKNTENFENFSKAKYLIKSLNNNNNLKKKQEVRCDNNITDAVFINNKSNVMDNDLKTNMLLNALTQFNNTQVKPSLFNFNNTNPSYNCNNNINNLQDVDYAYLSIQQKAEMQTQKNSNQQPQMNNINNNIGSSLSQGFNIQNNDNNFKIDSPNNSIQINDKYKVNNYEKQWPNVWNFSSYKYTKRLDNKNNNYNNHAVQYNNNYIAVKNDGREFKNTTNVVYYADINSK